MRISKTSGNVPVPFFLAIRDRLGMQQTLLDPLDDGQANVLQFVHTVSPSDFTRITYGVNTPLCEIVASARV